MMEWGEASLQLPAKYPQLPALLIGQIRTLIWRIDVHAGSRTEGTLHVINFRWVDGPS